ncbi:MAG TPA: TIGR01777 family oxidoreductase [Bryobacteraceae bacterium]|nr:TIGR01777 family oxidoreductase [Bryobacteraceae bacterium]
MNVAITGASGFVGSRLTQRLQAEGHATRAISLRSAVAPDALAGFDAVVNLAGENIAQKWTPAAKRRIRESRITGTRALVAAMRAQPPAVLVSVSAVGYYGSRRDEVLTERSKPGADFLAQVCAEWEREAMAAAMTGVRVALLRTGMVLGAEGGALPRMLPPFKLGVGGRLGSGTQWMSWIHIADLCDLIWFALREPTVSGPLNATSPNPVSNADFTRALARVLHRPALFPVPAFALKLIFGEMAEVLLGSQRAVPDAALHAGFVFQHPEIGAALRSLLAT